MQLVIANIHSKDGFESEMSDVLTKLAEASRHDDGCRSYQVLSDLETSTHFMTVEEWDTPQQVAEHLKTAHVAAALSALPDLAAGNPVITMHEVTSSTNLG